MIIISSSFRKINVDYLPFAFFHDVCCVALFHDIHDMCVV